jgi:hypothetical protein
MTRECTSCQREFSAYDLDREETLGMEAERKALGLTGVLFRFYTCPACGQNDIFVDLRPLPGETEKDFHARRQDLERVVTGLHAEAEEGVKVVLVAAGE